MDAIAEIMAKLPEMEIDGMLSERLEAKVWEKRMPDLTPAEQLAVEIDRFTYAYDVDSYHDNVRQMSENVSEISKMLEQGDTEDMKVWLNEVISEGAMPEEETRAKELIAKLAEYKPLAKIEEMEEQNYNMVDNILNNGCEKFSKEEAKKAQDKPAARQSLKSRLADKKAQIAGQGKDREENKKISKGRCKNMGTMFTVEESNLLCIFEGESRSKVIEDIEMVLPYLDDSDMEELSRRVIEKLQGMTDKEFEQLELVEAE